MQADIVEVPHHGSPHRETIELLDQLTPSVVLQSTGRSRLNDPRIDSARARSAWFASADKGSAWARITRAGDVRAGWWHGKE